MTASKGIDSHGSIRRSRRVATAWGSLLRSCSAQTGGNAEQGFHHLIFRHLAQDGAEVAAVEEGEVFEIDKLFKQGFPPDRSGLEA